MTKIIKNNNYLVIQGWMRTELNLKGSELLIYAVIYGFSQIENQKFTGSLQYLCDWTGCTKQGVIKSLKKLIEKNLIEKEEEIINNIKFCKYKVNTIKQSLIGIKQSLTRGIKQSLPNNKELYNKDINKENKNFLFFKKIIKKYNYPQKMRDKTIERLYQQLKTKFNNCLKDFETHEELEKKINNYLEYLNLAKWRKKCAFSAFINQSEKYLYDWKLEKKQELLRNKPKLTEKERIIQEVNGGSY